MNLILAVTKKERSLHVHENEWTNFSMKGKKNWNFSSGILKEVEGGKISLPFMSSSVAHAEEILSTLKAYSQCEARNERKVNKIYEAITSLPHTSLSEHFIVVVCGYSNNSSINRQQSLFYVCIFNINFASSPYVGICFCLSLTRLLLSYEFSAFFFRFFSLHFTSQKIWQELKNFFYWLN